MYTHDIYMSLVEWFRSELVGGVGAIADMLRRWRLICFRIRMQL